MYKLILQKCLYHKNYGILKTPLLLKFKNPVSLFVVYRIQMNISVNKLVTQMMEEPIIQTLTDEIIATTGSHYHPNVWRSKERGWY